MSRSLAVAGKGGTGKSTIAALIIKRLTEQNMGPVLAIDADPDANLGKLLGITPRQTIGELKEEVLSEIKNFPAGMSKANYIEAGLHQIIEESNGFDLVTMGRSEGTGCYCYINSLIRKFYEDLSPSYSWIVIDNEAGLEHISRMTTQNMDGLAVIITDNPLSIESAKRIEILTEDLKSKIKKKFLVSNMLKFNTAVKIESKLKEFKLKYLFDIPYDQKLEEIILNGESINALYDSPVLSNIDLIIKHI